MSLQSYGMLHGESDKRNEKAPIQTSAVLNPTGSKGGTAANFARDHLQICQEASWGDTRVTSH